MKTIILSIFLLSIPACKETYSLKCERVNWDAYTEAWKEYERTLEKGVICE